LKRPESEDPILILTPEDYRRYSTVPEPPRRSPSGQGSRTPIVVGIFLAAASVAAAAWLGREAFRPVPVAGVRLPRMAPRPPEPAIVDPFPVRPVASPAPEPDEPFEPPPPAAVPQEPWNGGRVWVRLRLRTEQRSHVRESEHRVTLVWEGSRFILERSAGDRPDGTMDRLELLLRLPTEDGSWRRQITATGVESISVRSGDLSCRRVEGEDRFPQGSRRFRYWYSDAFPAAAVQAEQTVGEFTFVARVLEFGAAGEGKQ
jgi:hypothetical protein